MIQFDNAIKYFSRTILTELNLQAYCYCAGGCIRDYFSVGKLTSDIDIYFSSETDFEIIKNYLINSEIETYMDDEQKMTNKKEKAIVLYENPNVIKVKYKGKIFDLVRSLYAAPKDCIAQFDFTVACAAIDLKEVYTHETFFIDLGKRQLMINALPFPLSTMWRMQKYIKKGYVICKGEMLKLAKAVSALSLNKEEDKPTIEIINSQMSEDSSLFMGFD